MNVADDTDDVAFTPTVLSLLLGAFLFAAGGLFIYWLIRCNRGSMQASGPALNPQPIILGSQALQPSDNASVREPSKVPRSNLGSYQLPFLGTQGYATMLATAPQVPYEITVRVVGPPGGLAALALDQSSLNDPQPLITATVSQIPIGETIIVPAGQEQTVYLSPGQALYGKGNMSYTNSTGPVIVSVVGATRISALDGGYVG